MATRVHRLPWERIDTVLLDMDGTLLDLAFDNYFWLELVPARYAAAAGLDVDAAKSMITRRYENVVGSLSWYCLDHWSGELGLDIAELKRSHRHLIRYLPGAERFLAALRAAGKPLSIVTNAHPVTISVKAAQTNVNDRVDAVVCSHELAAPKESGEFWAELARRHPFDSARTLLVEDSLAVLGAARDYGVRHTVAIRRPDSRLPARSIAEFPSVDGVADLLPASWGHDIRQRPGDAGGRPERARTVAGGRNARQARGRNPDRATCPCLDRPSPGRGPRDGRRRADRGVSAGGGCFCAPRRPGAETTS